jgi:hypothetical protein
VPAKRSSPVDERVRRHVAVLSGGPIRDCIEIAARAAMADFPDLDSTELLAAVLAVALTDALPEVAAQMLRDARALPVPKDHVAPTLEAANLLGVSRLGLERRLGLIARSSSRRPPS